MARKDRGKVTFFSFLMYFTSAVIYFHFYHVYLILAMRGETLHQHLIHTTTTVFDGIRMWILLEHYIISHDTIYFY